MDFFKGDSGGPGIEYIKGRGTLVGIVSFGITCAGNWIESIINSLINNLNN